MTASRRRWPVAGALLVLAVVALSEDAWAQYDLRQRPGVTTSDDPRRVPIPPRDSSKDRVLVLKGGTLFDGTGTDPVPDAVVVIVGNWIADVGPAARVKIPAKVDRAIDTTGLFIVPGLIDLHMHFRGQRGEDFGLYRDSEAAIAIRGVEKLGLYLDGDITAVPEMGGPGDAAQKIKEAVERRIFPGPRVFWAGHLIASRGGHGDEITETASGRPRGLETSSSLRIATGPWDWRLAVREEIRRGVDLIKLTAPYDRDEVTAAVDEAHMLGFPVAVDGFGEYVTWATEAGMNSIEHPLAIADETLRLMAERKTALVPTPVAFYNPLTFGYPSAHIPPGGFYFTMSRRFSMTHDNNVETVRKARAAGVTIGVGTLEKGKLADVLVVAANPLEDIQHLRKLRLVVADGRVVRDRIERAPVPPEPSRLRSPGRPAAGAASARAANSATSPLERLHGTVAERHGQPRQSPLNLRCGEDAQEVVVIPPGGEAFWHPIASIVTSRPRSANTARSLGMAVISFDCPGEGVDECLHLNDFVL